MDKDMVTLGNKPRRRTFEEFQKAVLEYQKKNAKNTVKQTA